MIEAGYQLIGIQCQLFSPSPRSNRSRFLQRDRLRRAPSPIAAADRLGALPRRHSSSRSRIRDNARGGVLIAAFGLAMPCRKDTQGSALGVNYGHRSAKWSIHLLAATLKS